MRRATLGGVVILAAMATVDVASACCPAPPSGKPVVNADQTVALVWDSAAKTEHFVRRASFKSDADDFGFLVPTPAQPELAESGDDAFPLLKKITEPEIKKMPRPSEGCGGCTRSKSAAQPSEQAVAVSVQVLDEKTVAGFHAVVLEASSASALTAWLKDNGYAFSPEVEAWAKPYVDGGWKITALKVAKDTSAREQKGVAASSLRLSFKTDRPLFPYREPETRSAAQALGASARLLRIYFLSDGRYDGSLTKEVAWTGTPVWSNELAADKRAQLLDALKLPPGTAGSKLWLTEFEDEWPYKPAPADLRFERAAKQDTLKRPPIIQYTQNEPPHGVNGSWAVVFGSVAALALMKRRARPTS